MAYQHPISIALAVCAGLSAFTLAFASRNKTQAIKLEHESPDNFDSPDLKGPFDSLIQPHELMDGIPINEKRFWKSTRLLKTLLSILVAALFSVETARLVIQGAVVPLVLHSTFTLYTLLLAILSISQSDAKRHWRYVLHIAALTSFATIALGVLAILPDPVAVSHPRQTLLAALHAVSFLLSLGSFLLSSSIPSGPPLYFNPVDMYPSQSTPKEPTEHQTPNVSGATQASILSLIFFGYANPVISIGSKLRSSHVPLSVELGELPIVPQQARAAYLFEVVRTATSRFRPSASTYNDKSWFWRRPNSGWPLLITLFRTKALRAGLVKIVVGSWPIAGLYYVPPFFMQRLIQYLELHPGREEYLWGWLYCFGLVASSIVIYTLQHHMFYLCNVPLQTALKVQLNGALFAKTLLRKDAASSSPASSGSDSAVNEGKAAPEEESSSSKAQVMNIFTTDADKVAGSAWNVFVSLSLPAEVVIATSYLYLSLLGTSTLVGVAAILVLLPMNHYASKIMVTSTTSLMTKRDQRMGFMNELLGAIRMIKFMAWERNSEARVLKIRSEELAFQRKGYLVEVFLTAISLTSPIIVTVLAFWHYTVVRRQELTPSIAFTSLAVFQELRYAFTAIPEIVVSLLQTLVSLKRIEQYLNGEEVAAVTAINKTTTATQSIILRNASITWPSNEASATTHTSSGSHVSTPRVQKFVLRDVSVTLPVGQLTLVCGKLGSGKTLLLLGLLGEADTLTGQVVFPRSPPDALASLSKSTIIPPNEWLVPGVSAYTPQVAWLLNTTIKENILFGLPLDEKRYQQTLEACALVDDLEVLEDGDESEIGERGVNLSGGQKARISLARSVYSRASTLLLDDILSAVDAHTARHLFDKCLKGPLLAGRTIVLVSHHVHLCAPSASYVIALADGQVQYAGDRQGFMSSGLTEGLVANENEESSSDSIDTEDQEIANTVLKPSIVPTASPASTTTKAPRKLIEDEARATGRVDYKIWKAYLAACGGKFYWFLFVFVFLSAAVIPIVESNWLRYWSASETAINYPLRYLLIYTGITFGGMVLQTLRWLVLFEGSIHASTLLYKRLLEAVLFASVRFHDTISRGRLLNRFGKDFETIDSTQARTFGYTLFAFLDVVTAFLTVGYVGGPLFLAASLVLGVMYWNVAKPFGPVSTELRRLDSTSRSPLYTMYGEVISGVTVLRAFGASTDFMRKMQRCIDANTAPYYWMWTTRTWLSVRFNLYSSTAIGFIGVIVLLNRDIDAATAAFALSFAAANIPNGMLSLVQRLVQLEQSLVALERIDEYSSLEKEGSEFTEPDRVENWPSEGKIVVKDLSVRYAPDLPDVLHDLNFEVQAGSKTGILGRTGGGKSSLALSFFRFITASKGQILIDGIDISKLGLTDLRSNLTIIPQEPMILSGTLRSTLDVFDEYDDADIYEALRRVHLIPADDSGDATEETVALDEGTNANIFRNLDSFISEGGDNLSVGQKQLLAMARAILKKSKVLFMDEATASVDMATDELIGQTMRVAFAGSTVLTIAHRLRTIIDYDKVLVLSHGRIVEYDQPHRLLQDSSSAFYSLCEATGEAEFAHLKHAAAMAASRST